MALGSPQWMYASGGDFTIDQSLRFEDGRSPYLARTFGSSPTSLRTWTLSFWMKRGNVGAANYIFSYDSGGNPMGIIGFNSSNVFHYYDRDSSSAAADIALYTTQVFRDPNAWMHFLIKIDTTQGTASNRAKIYINGSQVTTWGTETYPAQNYDCEIIKNHYVNISGWGSSPSSSYIDGYLAEVHFIDGTALTPSSFGETGTYGEWKPIEVSGLTYGTNGFYLDFADSADLGNDANGSNNWTVNNITATDQMLDSPTNNFATWNPIKKDEAIPNATRGFAQGNLQCTTTGLPYGAANGRIFGTIGVTSGKWYYEWIETVDASSVRSYIGWADDDHSDEIAYGGDGTLRGSGSNESYGATWDIGDIIGIAFNADTNALTCYKNGASQGEITISDNHTFGDNQAYFPFVWDGSGNPTITGVANFGQDSSFAGNETAQGNKDSNGIGDFYYTPPSGFLALCTSNLPAVAVTPSEHFNTVLYTGNGSTQSITGVGFQPDMVWAKQRTEAYHHTIWDAVRGATYEVFPNRTVAEQIESTGLTSFDSDGFSLAERGNANESGDSIVAWNWKANGSGSSNTDGSITSTVSANADAGFSIVSYTGTGSAGTVGHGLSSAPELVIAKNRTTGSNDWTVGADVIHSAWEEKVMLSSTAAKSATNDWNDAAPTATLFNVGAGSPRSNGDGDSMIAYCFHSVDGYSKVGSYTGNGNADGTFIYTGFRPRFILTKPSSYAHNWTIIDTERDTYNPVENFLHPNLTNAEIDLPWIDIVSNGFKFRNTHVSINGSYTYIYLAFSEVPFKFANAR